MPCHLVIQEVDLTQVRFDQGQEGLLRSEVVGPLGKLQERQGLLVFYRQRFVKLNHIFASGVAEWLFGSWAQDCARLVVAFVVHFGAVGHHFSQLIVGQVRVPFFFDPPHKLKLTDGADNAQVEEHEIRIVDKVCAVEIARHNINDANGHKLAIYPMVKVIRTLRLRDVAFIFERVVCLVYLTNPKMLFSALSFLH